MMVASDTCLGTASLFTPEGEATRANSQALRATGAAPDLSRERAMKSPLRLAIAVPFLSGAALEHAQKSGTTPADGAQMARCASPWCGAGARVFAPVE